ncbi:hypothetical protein FB451DRAFT_1407761 [Mycena latifolia]|nr:hypothetical protein FB451DRAFT_1407761 [Mycena latifolia]
MSSAPTAACFAALDVLESRLVNHHEIPRTPENSDSYSALLTKAVTMHIQTIEAELLQHHKALQSLSKSVERIKPSLALGATSFAVATTTPALNQPPPKPKTQPLPLPSDERHLVRCDGVPLEIFGLPYQQIIARTNVGLENLALHKVLYASRLNASSIFLVPEFK